MSTIDVVLQTSLCISSAAAIFLVGRKNPKTARWGFAVGLISQPFWFVCTYRAQQYGIFVLTFWYTYSWASGIWNKWGVKS